MNGILLFDKPQGWTSHDAVDFVRSRTGLRQVGHAGTLDPMATGLLLLLVGPSTKRANEFSGLDKSYEGRIRLGVETDTLDMTGKILGEKAFDRIERAELEKAMIKLTGEIDQVPPAYSAVKQGGKKLYELARKGIAVQVPPRKVRVEYFSLTSFDLPEFGFVVSCSKGTYVRSLADSLGKALGCGAALASLQRTRIGRYLLTDAVSKEKLGASSKPEIEKLLIT